jgi:hypothetical protein
VAAYFAVASYRKKGVTPADAAIWMLDPHAMNRILHGSDLTFPIDSITARKMPEPAFKERKNDKGDVLAVMAVEHDMRMFVQQGAFTIHSAMKRETLNTFEGHSRYLQPILIPAASVTDVAWEIYASGFRRGDLFPDLTNPADELNGVP